MPHLYLGPDTYLGPTTYLGGPVIMTKQTGLGDRLFVAGYNLSGDITALGNVGGGPAALDATGIDKSGFERVGGIRDGRIEATSWFNPGPAADAAHLRYKQLPVSDQILTYCRGLALGAPAACLVGKQVDYAGSRGNDGAFTFEVSTQTAAGIPLEWGVQATAGIESSASLLTGANSTFEGGIGNWVLSTNSTVAHSTAQARTGAGSLAITSTGTVDASAKHVSVDTNGFPVTPGRAYLVQGWFRAATAGRLVRMGVSWFTAAGALVSFTTAGSVTDTTTGWTLSGTVPLVAPATAASALVIAGVLSPGGAGEVHYVDDVSFTPQPAAVDLGTGSTTFGAQAYLHVTAFTGADATIKLQGSSDNGAADAFTDITGGAFAAVSGVGAQRIATNATATIERYLRPVVTTTGGFTELSYHVTVVRNEIIRGY